MQSEVDETMKMGLSGVEMAPFGAKLCQNVAPRLRIIFQALLGLKTQLKNIKNLSMLKIPFFTVQSHQLYIETPDEPLKRLICYYHSHLMWRRIPSRARGDKERERESTFRTL